MPNRYNSITDTKQRYNAVSSDEPVVVSPVKSAVNTKTNPLTPPKYKVSQAPKEQTMAEKYGLPEATISQAKPEIPAEKPSIWNRIARTFLPRGAEEYLGLRKKENPKELNAREQIMSSEADRQSLWRVQENKKIKETIQQDFIDKNPSENVRNLLNHPKVQPVIEDIAQRTSGTGIKSMIDAAGDKTFDEAYKANRAAQAGDTSKLHQFGYQLADTAPQTLFGTALAFVPYAGTALATSYWTALSANEQQQSRGEVTSMTNVGIDVALDSLLGKIIESLFKKPVTSLLSTIKKTFVAEGGTEVSQDLLKYGNDYREAKTEDEKEKAIQAAKEYFSSGQILMSAGVGGLSGAGVGAGAYAASSGKEFIESGEAGQKIKEQEGFAKVPFAEDKSTEEVVATPIVEETIERDVFDDPIGNSSVEMAADIKEKVTQSLPPDIASTIEPVEKVVAGEEGTPLKQQVGILDYFRTPWRVFEKMGIRPAYQKLLAGYEAYMKELPQNIDKITAWSKQVPKESNQRIFEYLDGETIELNANEAQVAKEIKAWMAQWADRLGMDPDARITDYITHIFPKGKGGEIPEEIAYMIRGKIPGSTYNPFLLERLGAGGYIKDTWRALDAYAKRATRKVNMDPGLAEVKAASDKLTHDTQIDYINNYVSKINLRPNRLDKMLDTSIKQLVGYRFGARPTAEITRSLRMMIARAKIGFSVVSFAKNITQGINTLADLGNKYTVIGYMDLVKYGGKELEENGVLIAPFIEDRKYSAIKGAVEKVDSVLFANMNASEFVNRGAAYYGGKAKLIAGKVKPKEYKMAFGKEMPKDYKPTINDAVNYGKFVAAKTQFKFGALDTPVAMNSNLMKLIFQFQTFSLKQTEFIVQMAKDKEYAKLIRYTTASMMLFQLIGSAFGMSWKDAIKPWRFGIPPALQFFLDLFNKGIVGKDKYGNILDTEEKVKATADTLLTNVVPGGVQAKRTFEGLGVVNEGAARSKSGKFKHKIEQTPSNYIRGGLFGKYNLPESKEYYKKKEDKAKGKSKSSGSNRYSPI